jgi:hypothetical protein
MQVISSCLSALDGEAVKMWAAHSELDTKIPLSSISKVDLAFVTRRMTLFAQNSEQGL